MFDSDKFEYTEYWKDKKHYEELFVKVKKNWSKGIIYRKQVEKLQKLQHKLVFHEYPTYQTLQRIGSY